MPTSFAETVLDLESLRSAIQKNQGLVPSVERFVAPLDAVIGTIQTLTAQQKTLIADKQKTTQDLKAAVLEATSLMRDIRAMVRGEIGARSEKLVEFGVTPLRKRTRKPKPAEEPPIGRSTSKPSE